MPSAGEWAWVKQICGNKVYMVQRINECNVLFTMTVEAAMIPTYDVPVYEAASVTDRNLNQKAPLSSEIMSELSHPFSHLLAGGYVCFDTRPTRIVTKR